MKMKYKKINFKNFPSTQTPLNAENLNNMEDAIDYLCQEEEKSSKTVAELTQFKHSAGKDISQLKEYVPASAVIDEEERQTGFIFSKSLFKKAFSITDRTAGTVRIFTIPFYDGAKTPNSGWERHFLNIEGCVNYGAPGGRAYPIGYNDGSISVQAYCDVSNHAIIVEYRGAPDSGTVTLYGFFTYTVQLA